MSSSYTPYATGYGPDRDDLGGAAHHAASRAPAHTDPSLFSTALGFLSSSSNAAASARDDDDVDEEAAVRHHQHFFGGGGGGDSHQQQHHQQQPVGADGVGKAAAVQAMKMFLGNSSGGGGGGSGGGKRNEFVGLAMAQAEDMFEQGKGSGKVDPSASKQDAVSSAAQTAFKMYMKSEMGSKGGFMGVASKFM